MASHARESALRSLAENDFGVNLPARCSDNAPIVIVLGHLSMERAEVAKYCSLVLQGGYPAITATLPMQDAVCSTSQLVHKWVECLLDFVVASGLLCERSLVLYALGHGGSLAVHEIDKSMQRVDRFMQLHQRVVAIVFDSSPSYGTRAFHNMVDSCQSPCEAVTGLALKAVAGLLFFAPVGSAQRFWHNMTHLSLGHRWLYLYSFDSSKCDSDRIDRLVAERKALGAAVEWHKWPCCEMWGPEYRQRVLEFLRVVEREHAHPLELGFSRVARRGEE